MRTIFTSLFVMSIAASAQAQIKTATLEQFFFQPDTFYVNYTNSGMDVGFDDSGIHFPCVYDTSFGGFWSSGFAWSTVMDSLTPGYSNQYASKAFTGDNNSKTYAVAYGTHNYIKRLIPAEFISLSLTNTTYAYESMNKGDAFAKKFGGASGNDQDWFKIVLYGYLNGIKMNDSIEYYLADFRFTNNSLDYIIKEWKQIDLNSIKHADSITFTLSSSDTGSFGMNTPAYFCIDNINMALKTGIDDMPKVPDFSISPNPCAHYLNIHHHSSSQFMVAILSMDGRKLFQNKLYNHQVLDISSFPTGTYVLQVDGHALTFTKR